MHQPLLRACSRLLVIAMCATLIPFLCAEDIYVAQIARGAGTGHDAANAHSVAFFNMEGNWHSPAKKAGKIGPGDTVHLVGTISDGYVRRGLLRGLMLDDSADSVTNTSPLVVPPQMSIEAVLHLMQVNKLGQLPIVDEQRRVISLHVWDELQ